MALGYTPGERADKSKRTRAQRKQDNKGTKDGAIRVGAGGKFYNKYDAKTGTWRRVTTVSKPNMTATKPTADTRKAKAEAAAKASGQVPSATRSYSNGVSRSQSPSQASRGDRLGLNPATGGTRPPARPASDSQQNRGPKRPTTSPNKRGGGMTTGRDTGNHKPVYYANGTASVWDPSQKKRVTVGKNDRRYPKR